MSYSIALPRVRRKRRKPMPPWLKFWLLNLILCLGIIAWCVVAMIHGKGLPWIMFTVVLEVYNIHSIIWPATLYWWKVWQDDE